MHTPRAARLADLPCSMQSKARPCTPTHRHHARLRDALAGLQALALMLPAQHSLATPHAPTCMCAGQQLAWRLLAQDHALGAARQLQQEGGVGLAMLELLHTQGPCAGQHNSEDRDVGVSMCMWWGCRVSQRHPRTSSTCHMLPMLLLLLIPKCLVPACTSARSLSGCCTSTIAAAAKCTALAPWCVSVRSTAPQHTWEGPQLWQLLLEVGKQPLPI